MQVGNISNIYNIKNGLILKRTPSFRSGNCSDSFERTTSNLVSQPNKQTAAEESEIRTLFKDEKLMTEKLRAVIKNPDDNIIGKGFSHSAYKLPGFDDYILRKVNRATISPDFKIIDIKDTSDKNLKVNIGQKIGEITVADRKSFFPVVIEVLKKQKGTPIGNPPSEAIFSENTGNLKEGELPYGDIVRKETYAQSLHSLAKLPVEAYEKLIENIQKAYAAGYSFDHLNSNNLLIDEENGNINIIDMEKARQRIDYGNILYALTNIYYFSTYTSKYDGDIMAGEQIEAVLEDTIEITDKYIQAMKNKNVKFDKEEYSYEFLKFLSSLPCSFYCKTAGIDDKWNYFEQIGVA